MCQMEYPIANATPGINVAVKVAKIPHCIVYMNYIPSKELKNSCLPAEIKLDMVVLFYGS